MRRVVLLGDSIFDNAAYVAGGPDVIKQVQACLPAGWEGILRAVDGHVTTEVQQQLAGLPAQSYLIVSVGGNDALGHIDILNQRAHSTAEVLHTLADIHDQFHANYQQMLTAVLHQGCPTALCTIYYPRFPDPVLQRLAVTALTIFNDCILHHAFAAGLPVLHHEPAEGARFHARENRSVCAVILSCDRVAAPWCSQSVSFDGKAYGRQT